MRIKAAPSAAKPYPRYAACDSITNFGAVGNGTADDAVALQKAIDAVGSGCSIYFPPGVYRLASTVTIKKDITLQLGPQVEIRQFARLVPDSHGVRSLTVVGEGPGTSIWAQAIGSPFWSGSNSPLLKAIRLLDLEFKPYSAVQFPHFYGGSTDLLEMNSVTVSPGSANPLESFSAQARSGTLIVASPARTILTDIEIFVNIDMNHQDRDLSITRFRARCPGYASILFARAATGTSRLLLTSFYLDVGGTAGGYISNILAVMASDGAIVNAVLNDVEMFSTSYYAALGIRATSGSEVRLLANSFRFRTTYGATEGHAIRMEDRVDSVVRAVFAGGFLQSSTPRSDAAIQGSLVNSSSLRTIAGMDQRGWASLT
jgi:hypothetical protein